MKGTLSRHKVSIFTVAVIAVTSCFLVIACRKQSSLEPQKIQTTKGSDNVVADAKSYFQHTILNKESDRAVNSVNLSSKGATLKPLPIDRMEKISNIVDWDNGFEVLIDGVNYLFIAVKENIKPFKNKDFEFFRYLIFSTNSSGTKTLSIVEVLGDSRTSLGDNHARVAIASLTNKLKDASNQIETLNASVIFYTSNYQRETSFHIDNGIWSEKRISFRSDLQIHLK